MSVAEEGFRGVRRRPAAAPPEPGLPFRVDGPPGGELARWARDHRARIDALLLEHGGLLFDGQVEDVRGFGEVAEALVGILRPYRERSSPRSELFPGVYTSTEHASDQRIAVHNENSYQRSCPARLVLGCLRPADRGGATPLADCRRVLALVDEAIQDRFRSSGVRYVRRFGLGVGLSWEEAFGTRERSDVDEYCARRGIATSWEPDGVLRTEQLGVATARHPVSGAEVWFNHAAFFHPSGLAPKLRSALVEQFGTRLPADVTYGDGEPIDDPTAAHLRAAYAAATRAQPWRRGEVVLVDNLLVAHGREPFAGPRRVVVSLGGEVTPAA